MPERKRHRRNSWNEVEDQLPSTCLLVGLDEQKLLIALNHSKAENVAARERAMAFVESGWGAVDWSELVGQK